MREDLTLLAWSSHPFAQTVRDKYLDGYSTIQFVRDIHGCLIVGLDDRIWRLEEGEWFFPAYPGPRLRFYPEMIHHHWYHRHIGFQGPLVEAWRAAGLWLMEPQFAPPGTDWTGRMEQLLSYWTGSGRWDRLHAINGLEKLLIDLAEARLGQGNPSSDRWLQNVLQQLDNWPPDQELRLDRFAAATGWSQTELRRRFKAATGITMQEHVLQGKMARARALLAETQLPLKTIAAQLGYANEFYFSRQFKERVGMPPGQWRRRK